MAKKALHLARSLEELNTKCDVDGKTYVENRKLETVKQTCDLLLQKAKEYERDDEEVAYVNYMRAFNVFTLMRKRKDYDARYYDAMLKDSVTNAIHRAQLLSDILKIRYAKLNDKGANSTKGVEQSAGTGEIVKEGGTEQKQDNRKRIDDFYKPALPEDFDDSSLSYSKVQEKLSSLTAFEKPASLNDTVPAAKSSVEQQETQPANNSSAATGEKQPIDITKLIINWDNNKTSTDQNDASVKASLYPEVSPLSHVLDGRPATSVTDRTVTDKQRTNGSSSRPLASATPTLPPASATAADTVATTQKNTARPVPQVDRSTKPRTSNAAKVDDPDAKRPLGAGAELKRSNSLPQLADDNATPIKPALPAFDRSIKPQDSSNVVSEQRAEPAQPKLIPAIDRSTKPQTDVGSEVGANPSSAKNVPAEPASISRPAEPQQSTVVQPKSLDPQVRAPATNATPAASLTLSQLQPQTQPQPQPQAQAQPQMQPRPAQPQPQPQPQPQSQTQPQMQPRPAQSQPQPQPQPQPQSQTQPQMQPRPAQSQPQPQVQPQSQARPSVASQQPATYRPTQPMPAIDRTNKPTAQSTPTAVRTGEQTQQPASASQTKILKPARMLTTLTRTQLRDLEPRHGRVTPGLTGLFNMHNTCFFNSAIQTLSHTPNMVRYFVDDGEVAPELLARSPITAEWSVLLKALWCGNFIAVRPTAFARIVQKRLPDLLGASLCDTEQQDAQEFLMQFLDVLNDELNAINRNVHASVPQSSYEFKKADVHRADLFGMTETFWKNHTLSNQSIMTVFQGLLLNTIICSECRMRSYKFEPFQYLSLPIPQRTNPIRIDACLKEFLLEEVIDDRQCDQCKRRCSAKKKMDIVRLPSVLIVHLKRFQVDPTGRRAAKRSDWVIYPPDLNLHTQLHPVIRSRIIPDKTAYSLYGVVNHSGTLTSGHYTATVLHASLNSWFYFDDEQVTQCSVEKSITPAGYILFYSKTQLLRIAQSNYPM